jgi:hypothetical protein
MMRHSQLEHRFVQHIPVQLEPGVLYVSMEYGTAAHSCCCGCGEEVVTPFTPTDWKMTFDGETISLWPSVGNWNFPCRSHYVIECSQVIEMMPWTDAKIAAERRRDKAAKASFYATPEQTEAVDPTPIPTAASENSTDLWSRLKHWRSKLSTRRHPFRQ